MGKRRQLRELPVRQCRYGERCLVCLRDIDPGGGYHDGGHGRRVHLHCAEAVAAGQRREPTRAEVRELERAELNVSRAKGEIRKGARDVTVKAAVQLLVAAEERVSLIKAGWAQPEAEEVDHG